MRARRALLYVPGDDRHKIEKALTLGVDCICMDLEDGVALSRKVDARHTVAAALQELDFGRSEKVVRINAPGSGMEEEDIQLAVASRPDGLVVPLIESLDQVQWVSEKIEAMELSHGWPLQSIRLLVEAENPKAFLNLKDIASHTRLDALIFGDLDYAASVGAIRTAGAEELFYARSALVMVCGAFALQAIDMVSTDFRNMEALRREASFGAQLGFAGKQIIHPNQVAPVQEAFTPDDAAIEAAKGLVEAFEAHQARGSGAFALDGRMIDITVVKVAKRVLERARAAGKIM